ncbi:cilia- and flagella-associated protein 97 [Eucyclogobius newberryi]|uniref:cilia- and flagella-associated protein 97 n=1 Tax=Eucyclogobius newberryi TaxID=166745 RepID=UPI003B58D7B0
MSSASDLEGEVDHTFFDSDSEDGGEKGEDADNSPTSDVPQSADSTDCLSENETETHLANNAKRKIGRKSNKPLAEEDVGEKEFEEDASYSDSEMNNEQEGPSSPNRSRLKSADLNHSDVEEDKIGPSRDLSSVEYFYSEEEYNYYPTSRQDGRVVMQCPGVRHRKNYSFTNSEVRRIDRDNDRLLWRLANLATSSRPGSAHLQSPVTSNVPVKSSPHSAINRQREQQRIAQENQAALKRLKAVKPSAGMKRSDQLADYRRQASYPGVCSSFQISKEKCLGSKHSTRAASSARVQQ